MRKLLNILLILFLCATMANASSIDRTIEKNHINKDAVSISVKDLSTGKVVYEHLADKPVMPASTLKVVTFAAALNELGTDYKFKTCLYKNNNNEVILKLGADPFLTNQDLKSLLRTVKQKNISPKIIKIDDTVLDNVEWGEGWQWDDSVNPLMPKFSSYNLDKNLLILFVEPTTQGLPAYLQLKEYYPLSFMNMVLTAKTNNIKLSKNDLSANLLTVEGTVAKKTDIVFPVDNPKRYFMLKLDEAVKAAKLGYYGKFVPAKLQNSNIYLIDSVENSIEETYVPIFKDSNNMVTETVFKIAGGHFAQNTGTAENALEMLMKYLKDLSLNTDNINIVDGSGVSKNNVVNADFMTSFLLAQNERNLKYKELFAIPGEGTLKNRMLYFRNDLRAKTGTLAGVSAITGFITSLSGKTYVFYINIDDAKSKASQKRELEEYILRDIYSTY